MQTLEPILREHTFFKGLRDDHMKLLVGCAANVRFDADTHIFHEGEEANHFYIIREGRVAIEIPESRRKAITIETLGPDDVLGWSWLVAPFRWNFDARVVAPTRAISLDAKCLRGKCDDDHELGYELFKRVLHIVQHRLQAARIQLLNVYGGTA